jgi:hypothetical protein
VRPSEGIDPDDLMYVRNMLAMADEKGWDHPDVDWMIQRAANEFDPERIICVMLLSWLASLQQIQRVPQILAFFDSYCNEAMTDERASVMNLGERHG